jgi:hypothetical protein
MKVKIEFRVDTKGRTDQREQMLHALSDIIHSVITYRLTNPNNNITRILNLQGKSIGNVEVCYDSSWCSGSILK